MAIAWQVFVALVAFAVLLCLLVLLRRGQRAMWDRVRPVAGRTTGVIALALLLCAIAGGIGFALAWATR